MKTLTSFLFCLCLVLIVSAARAECIDYGIYPHVLGSAQTDFVPEDFAVSGSHLYAAASEDGFRVIDISNPTLPIVVGSLETTSFGPQAVAADERYAYIAVAYSGLWIIDVADPAHPVVVSTVPTPGYAIDVAIQGNLVYFTDRENGMYVVDVSDHSAPVVIGHLDFGNDARGIAVQGSYAYVGRAYGGDLYVIDVSNPAAPFLVTDVAISGYPQEIAISGDHAYLACGSSFVVIDISNPAFPAVVATVLGDAANVEVQGDFAYVMSYAEGLFILDVSRPDHPVRSGVFNLQDSRPAVAVVDGRAYLGAFGFPYRWLGVVDVSQPRPVETIGSVALPYAGMRIDAAGDFAYATSWQNGLNIIDATDPSTPVIIAQLRPPVNPSNIYSDVLKRDEYVYLAYGQYFFVIQVQDPAHPRLLRTLSMDLCDAAASTFSGNYGFFLDACDRLWAADVSVPPQAQILGHIWMSDRPGGKDVAVVGRYAYVAGTDHMDIVDTADPAHLTLAATVAEPCPPARVAAAGSYLYLACRESLCILDISDPLSPVTRGCVTIPGADGPRDIALLGSTAYVSDGDVGLQVIDVSNPDAPRIAGLDGDVQSLKSVAATESFVCQIDDDRVVILPLQCEPAATPEDGTSFRRPMLVAAPLPSHGDVSLRFTLPRAGAVALDVLNAAGRRIRSLREGNAGSGPNELLWDGRDDGGRRVESGIYFIRMQWEGGHEIARAVVLH